MPGSGVTLEPVAIETVVKERLGATLVVGSGYLLFADVDPRGTVAELGARESDALVELDGKQVSSVQDVFESLRRFKRGDTANVLIYRFSRGRPVRKIQGDLKL